MLVKSIAADEFINQYGDNPHYELIDGEVVEMEPTGKHEQVGGYLGRKFNVAIEQQNLTYFLPHRCLIKLLGTNTAFRPDLIILDQTQLKNEPLWEQEPVVTSGETIKLIAEIVSSNWQNDYARKVEDYALLGVQEYWIVDYLGLGGRDYIGSPKLPTITVCQLVNDRYQKQLFQNDQSIRSTIFPDLKLSVQNLLSAINL